MAKILDRQEIIGIIYGTLVAHHIGEYYPVDDILQIAEDIHDDLQAQGLLKQVVSWYG